jgi:DNA-binding PadR family transcriptional regulator
MSLRYALLGLLAARPMAGYDLTGTFDRSLANVWPASHSQIYPELARLAEAGLIRQAASGPRGKKIYEITPDGLEAMRSWLQTEPDHGSRNPSFLRVFFLWLMEPDEALRFLEDEAAVHEAKLLEYERGATPEVLREGAAFSFRLALEWGIRYERHYLEWNAWASQQIAAGRAAPSRQPARRD